MSSAAFFVISPFHLSTGLDFDRAARAKHVWMAPFDGLMVLHQSVLEGHHFFVVSSTHQSYTIVKPNWYSMVMKSTESENTYFDVEVSGLRVDDAKAMIHPITIPNRKIAKLVSAGYIQLHTVGTMVSHRILWDSFVGGHRLFRWAHWQVPPQVPAFSNSKAELQCDVN